MSHADMGLVDYVRRLVEREDRLERELVEVRIARAHAERELASARPTEGRPTPVAAPVAAPHANGNAPYVGMGNEAAALAYLRGESIPRKTAEIARALEAGGLESEAKNLQAALFGSLKRLVNRGEVKKVGEGRRMRWVAVREPVALLSESVT